MDRNDKDIWTMAAQLIAKHGERAAAVAQAGADKALRGGDEPTRQIWLWIAEAVGELVQRPEKGENLN
jgi:hypothetical protein